MCALNSILVWFEEGKKRRKKKDEISSRLFSYNRATEAEIFEYVTQIQTIFHRKEFLASSHTIYTVSSTFSSEMVTVHFHKYTCIHLHTHTAGNIMAMMFQMMFVSTHGCCRHHHRRQLPCKYALCIQLFAF